MPSGSSTSGVGRVIAGRYLLLHRLGGGGMGHVWLAHDQRLVCEVALKEIVFRDPAEADHEREARVARARAEARHAAGLRDHPHVVTVHDVLEHEGLPWIVMEYVAGAVDLRDLVEQRGPLAPAECARIGLAVLDALNAGHQRGVLHRDVKPANILLAPDRTGAQYGRVLLTDYGISVQPSTGETRWTMASALVGTSGYLAPERATGGAPTPAADLFSLGCTLYFGVEGQGPFTRASHLAELTAVVDEEPRPALRAGALEPVVHALLAKDPAARPSAVEAEAALSRIVVPQAGAYSRTQTDLGSQPQWAAPAAPRPRHARRRVLHSALAGLLGLALAGSGVWYAVAGQSGDEGSPRPYGEGVGLARALEGGDCVLADWPGAAPFQGTPRLTLDPSCADQAPDGQVMTFVKAASVQEARTEGAARCEERTQELRGRLADVRAFAVVPTEAGFEAAGRRTACLVLGAHGPVYGPLGGYRKPGTAFADTATMQRRDCVDVRSNREARLVSCAGAYDEQVLGFTRLGEDVTLTEARTESDAACAREVPPRDYGFDPSVYTAGSWTSQGAWKTGTHFAVCTVRKQNGGTMEGDEP
ncbi:protein serine/threonine kinase [Streptomyces davaonensis JCM 4913]|uniref:non-specific serine/threonine protein kinase n=1 Tax=Streptomyces davaonensis (strain DSM 101723 / JCM 4913 / KCC S-0913 / 768) TaxID=1214101 RepID=K4RE01_STRDJ|nr:serine/threonine-protein kinase [Streptomyces davaonensis]CCK31747.1 protein serine/threonine kinase [Streptomyces davaonensis JCM 4913]